MHKKRIHEEISRSLVKALTFRIVVLVSDSIIMFSITHRYDVTVGLVIFSNLASSTIYFFHERLWNNVHWGRKNK